MLIGTGLLSIPHLDSMLAKSINARKPKSVAFLTEIMRETVLSDRHMAYRTDFVASLEAAGNWLQEDPSQQAIVDLIAEFKPASDDKLVRLPDEQREQTLYIFYEWLQLYRHISATEKHFAAFVLQLHENHILDSVDSVAFFIRTCLEYALESFDTESRRQPESSGQMFLQIDALAKLIIFLTKYQLEQQEDLEASSDKVTFLKAILAIIVLHFNNQYNIAEQAYLYSGPLPPYALAESFPQRAYFRLFSSLLAEYHYVEKSLEPWNFQILCAFR